MRSLGILLVFFFTTLELPAQVEWVEIKRSKAMLSADHPNKVMVGAHNDLAWEYYHAHHDSALDYVNKSFALSEEMQDSYWQAVPYDMMAILKEIAGQAEEALNLYLKVIPLREYIGGKGLEATSNNMAVIFRNQDNYAKR